MASLAAFRPTYAISGAETSATTGRDTAVDGAVTGMYRDFDRAREGGMGLIFTDDLHDEFGGWPLSCIPYGGADFGEIRAVARAVGNGDDGAFWGGFVAAGDRLAAEAATALAKGHRASSRELGLRAACFYGAAYHPIYGAPVDPRLLDAFRKQIAAFDRGLALGEPPVAPLRIPFEGGSMPAYLLPAAGRAGEVRPLLILTNGYDATVTDMYFASAVAASRRGYHCLLFDGPGQGELLYAHGIALRPDWETVVVAVVDFALGLEIVDPRRIALSGWSLGGYLAMRAATGEPRLAALIADPGLWGITAGLDRFAIGLGVPPEAAANLVEADQGVLDRMAEVIAGDRKLRWTFVQRGYWVHGVDNLRDYLRVAATFTLDGRADEVRCPALVTMAENDLRARSAEQVYDALRSPKTLMRFTAEEGAGEHCESQNRSLLNRRALDWLDETLAQVKSTSRPRAQA